MITQEPINNSKHRSDKYIINKLYENFNNDIRSLICQTGNLYEVILSATANFERVADFLRDYASKNIDGRDFSMIWLLQVGNDKKEIYAINSKYLTYDIEIFGKTRRFYLVQLAGTDQIDVYEDFMHHEVLRKHHGEWFMHGNKELAKALGEIVEHDEAFNRLGFKIENYKMHGE